jgi:hypothetical protein
MAVKQKERIDEVIWADPERVRVVSGFLVLTQFWGSSSRLVHA